MSKHKHIQQAQATIQTGKLERNEKHSNLNTVSTNNYCFILELLKGRLTEFLTRNKIFTDRFSKLISER